jgi:hypothetical protein
MPKHYYFRAEIDFTVWEKGFADRLRKMTGERFADERLGQYLNEAVRQGAVEIDAISKIEDHGDSEVPGPPDA